METSYMKKAFWMIIILLFMNFAFVAFMIHNAEADSVTLQWDANDPAPDGYLMFQRKSGESYDYSSPVVAEPQTNAAGDIPAPTNTLTIDNLGIVCDITLYHWVVRAYIGDGASRDTSGDSNEVELTVDWSCPIAVENFQAIFDKAASNINMSFQQTGAVPVKRWKVFWKRPGDASFTEFTTVTNDGSNSAVVTEPFTEVAANTREDIVFTVVSFRFDDNDQVFSPNATEVTVDIDRRTLQPPTLRIELTVPVE